MTKKIITFASMLIASLAFAYPVYRHPAPRPMHHPVAPRHHAPRHHHYHPYHWNYTWIGPAIVGTVGLTAATLNATVAPVVYRTYPSYPVVVAPPPPPPPAITIPVVVR